MSLWNSWKLLRLQARGIASTAARSDPHLWKLDLLRPGARSGVAHPTLTPKL